MRGFLLRLNEDQCDDQCRRYQMAYYNDEVVFEIAPEGEQVSSGEQQFSHC